MTLPPEDEQIGGMFIPIDTSGTPHAALPLFFLHSLEIENFRSIEKATFTFQPGLNVIIGANNTAKTGVIDALRIIFSLGTYERKDLIRLRPTDVFSDGNTPPSLQAIKFTATFYGKNDATLPAQFYEMLCVDELVTPGNSGEEYAVFKLMYRIEFEYSQTKLRYEYLRNDLRGGASLSNSISRSSLDAIQAIYLAPLRDLVNDKARVGAEIERLIISHTLKGKEDERKNIPKTLESSAITLIKKVTDDKHHAAAGENLAQYAKPYEISEDSLTFTPDGISDQLFSRMVPVFAHSLHGLTNLPLSSNGLGINQLIYASIVLSRRGEAKVDDHIRRFFLIEEPEAHLHPQLQDSFFHALNQITDHQLFVTSHSPTITAKTDIDKIIVMRRDAANRIASPLHLANAFVGREEDKKYLHKFLDITRSQLLFARGAVFVEGVTEAMLMQHFSELIGCNLRDSAVEIIVIDSNQGYNHFRPLFDNGDDTFCRAVFITDGDESPADVPSDAEFVADSVGALDRGLEVSGSTATATGYGTFEFGLLRSSLVSGGNEQMQALLTAAMEKAAPPVVRNAGKQALFARDFLDFEKPSLAYKKMKHSTAKGTDLQDSDWYGTWRTNDYFRKAKSDFAFYLNEQLATDETACSFIVPKYIMDAIRFIVGTQVNDSEDTASASDA